MSRERIELAEAETAAAHVARLASLSTAVVTASSMFADGEVFEAERVIREFLRAHPDHIEEAATARDDATKSRRFMGGFPRVTCDDQVD